MWQVLILEPKKDLASRLSSVLIKYKLLTRDVQLKQQTWIKNGRKSEHRLNELGLMSTIAGEC